MPGGSILGDSNLVFGTAKTSLATAREAAAPSASTPICGAARSTR